MDYPNNFDIPSFSAGKTVALSRSVSIWISIVFFLIVSACGFVLFARYLTKNYPFLISIDPYTEEWTVVTYPKATKTNVQQYEVVQEKLVRDYVTNWFSLSEDESVNELRWQKCSLEECTSPEQFKPDNLKCAISCKSSEKVFEDFSERVVPWYLDLMQSGTEKWSVDRMLITRNRVFENISRWQIIAEITSNIHGTFKILSFIEIKRDINKYPATFGYYVDEFNAYRLNNE